MNKALASYMNKDNNKEDRTWYDEIHNTYTYLTPVSAIVTEEAPDYKALAPNDKRVDDYLIKLTVPCEIPTLKEIRARLKGVDTLDSARLIEVAPSAYFDMFKIRDIMNVIGGSVKGYWSGNVVKFGRDKKVATIGLKLVGEKGTGFVMPIAK